MRSEHNLPTPTTKLFTPQYFVLLAMSIFQSGSFGSFFMFPLFVLDIGGSEAEIGILMGVTSITAVVLRPWISSAVDKYGRKKCYGFGSLMMALFGGAHILFQQDIETSFVFLLILRICFGVGFGVCIVSSLTLAGDLSPQNRLNEGMGISGAMSMVGLALGPMVSEWLVSKFSFSAMFIWVGGLGLAMFVCFILLKEPLIKRTKDQIDDSFFTILRHPTVLRMAVIKIIFGFVFSAHGSFVSPFAASKGLLVSTYFFSYSLVAGLSRAFVGKAVDRLGEKKTLPFTFILVSVGFFLLVYLNSIVGLIIVGALIGMGHGVLLPGLLAINARAVSPNNLGKATGIVTGGFDAGLFLGSVGFGFVGEYFGLPMIFIIASIVILLGLILFLLPQKSPQY